MAKKRKGTNIFDLKESELQQVSKKIIKETTVPQTSAEPAKAPKQPKTTKTPKQPKEPLKVLRVRGSFHRKAKRMAFDRDIMIQELIEELILKEWAAINSNK